MVKEVFSASKTLDLAIDRVVLQRDVCTSISEVDPGLTSRA